MRNDGLIYSIGLEIVSTSKLSKAEIDDMAGKIIESICAGRRDRAIYSESDDLVKIGFVRFLHRPGAMS